MADLNEIISGNQSQCIHCKKVINEKPWITIKHDDTCIHGCSYMCSKNIKDYIGSGYWENVVNVEDFSEPRPVSTFKYKNDITVNFGGEQIKNEIIEEELRMRQIEEDYYNDSSDEENIE